MTASDMADFQGYLRNCTDRQVQGVYDKEAWAGRWDYAQLAVAEARARGIVLDPFPNAGRDEETCQPD